MPGGSLLTPAQAAIAGRSQTEDVRAPGRAHFVDEGSPPTVAAKFDPWVTIETGETDIE
jgi:hypothetical protein